MLNWNFEGGGHGNNYVPSLYSGTQAEDIPGLAERLINGRIDVATLQEVWRSHAKRLEEELNKRAAPGEHWEVHFGKADHSGHYSGSWTPLPWRKDEDAGNAVVVRTRPGVSTTDEIVIPLTGDDSEKGRSATKVHIDVD